MSSPRSTEVLEITFEVDGEPRRYHFADGPVRIGRHPDADVVIDAPQVSRDHATVHHEQDQWIVRDDGSINGIELRGERVPSHVLTGTDRLVLGQVPVTFTIVASPLREEPPAEGLQLTERMPLDDLTSVFERTLAVPAPKSAADGTLRPMDVVAMLKAATEALIAHGGLDTMFERVLDLVFEHLPVDRAHILLLDSEGQLQPRAQRHREQLPTDRLQISRSIADEAIRSKQAVLVVDASTDTRFDSSQSVLSFGIRSAMCVPLCDRDQVVGLVFVDRKARNAFTRTHLEVLSILAGLSATAIERTRLQQHIERERAIRARLSRYHAPTVVDRIIAEAEVDTQGMTAEERDISVLFADIAGFTRLSESLPAREVTGLLNEVFEALTAEVFASGGTLDKFMGDAVMVFFGAPLLQPDHAERAVRVALAMQARMAERNAARPDGHQLLLRIGINTGTAIVGDVGARQRRDYTVIGDTVNTASRLESSVAAPGQVVIGPECFRRLGARFDCRALPPVELRGKTKTVQPYLVLGAQPVPDDQRTEVGA